MKNEHLVPINVIDIVEKLNYSSNENERNNYIHRLEVIREYCDLALSNSIKNKVPDHNRKGKYSRIGLKNV